MSAVNITGAYDIGDDVLLVKGEREIEVQLLKGSGKRAKLVTETVTEEVEVRGWVSALTHHLPDDAYDANGDRREDKHGNPRVEPRQMTADEKRAYCESLFEDGPGALTQVEV